MNQKMYENVLIHLKDPSLKTGLELEGQRILRYLVVLVRQFCHLLVLSQFLFRIAPKQYYRFRMLRKYYGTFYGFFPKKLPIVGRGISFRLCTFGIF